MGKGVLIIVLAAVIGGTAMVYNSKQTSLEMDARLSRGHESNILARELARSGMNVAVGKTHRDWDASVSYINGTLARIEQEGGDYQATATATSPTSIEIDITGTFREQAHRIRKTLVMAGPLDGAFVVDVPQVDPTFDGGTFLIDGEDRRPPSAGGVLSTTAMNKPGLKTSSVLVRDHFGATLASQLHRVRGLIDNDGTVGNGSLKADNNWEVDLDTLYQEAVNHPQKQVLGGQIDGGVLGLTMGSAANPVIAHVPYSTVITGLVTGYGILIVDGTLTVTDDFTWEGIVLVWQDAGNLTVNYGGNAQIYGSLIVVQRSDEDWAFTMPEDGRLQVTYKYSSAGFGSEVWIDPWGLDIDLLFERGSNRTGDQMSVYDMVFQQGQRVNFYINVEGCETATTDCEPKHYWDHYAAGHGAPGGNPYAQVEQLGQHTWEIRFEDLPESHPWEDWDYNDQVIEVEIIPESGATPDDDPWWTGTGGSDDGDGGGSETAPSMGDTFYYTMSGNAKVVYSAEAIARLGAKLDVIREATRIVVVDQWEGRTDGMGS